jgi:hypothetical protein
MSFGFCMLNDTASLLYFSHLLAMVASILTELSFIGLLWERWSFET